METTQKQNLFTPVLIASSLILMLGFAVRASFGVFQIPIAQEFSWLRSEFSLAIAFQNLAWGFGQPIFGAIAEKLGDRKAIFIGILCYVFGLVASSFAITPAGHQMLSLFVGFGVAGMGFGVILAIVGRAASDENRSMAMGIATAVGSVGQIIGPPAAEYLLTYMNWSSVFLVFAGVIMASVLLLPFLKTDQPIKRDELDETLGEILKKALSDPSFTLIFIGFFSCGFQLAFVTAHFPAFVTEMCGPIAADGLLASIGVGTTSALGALAIAVIGAANIIGTIAAGYFGKRYKKKNLLMWIYVARTVVAAAFILFPMTPVTVLLFSFSMGLLWLATVPLTSGLVGYIYGLRYMGTLYGLVFFSHQLGSFLGVWLGGQLYDIYGTYNTVWWVGVGVGAFSALVHIPVKEIPLKLRQAVRV
ncbi:MFS transporter [Amylibacter kogurei]|uniref:MFS transporter n=1 Tax=Paramylibacter kogurei TaxID=1889778 RepID=A0A2G5K014_9RHOB|nr:MFS transporter [Amylibacter kogurei]PIB22868.1 MFS transporter [Amylibacter kogurei]